jgi:hypothetical protein
MYSGIEVLCMIALALEHVITCNSLIDNEY